MCVCITPVDVSFLFLFIRVLEWAIGAAELLAFASCCDKVGVLYYYTATLQKREREGGDNLED